MVAIGIGTPIYLLIQALIAGFVYREASAQSRRSPLVLAGSIFILSIVAVFIVGSILLVLLVQAVVITVYISAFRNKRTAPQ